MKKAPAVTGETPLGQHLTEATLRRMAGARSFARGLEYFNRELVKSIAEQDSAIAAKVEGTNVYRVRLWVRARSLEYACTCPVGDDGEFCKHCVAVGLTWLDQGNAVADSASAKRVSKVNKPAVTMQDVRDYLAAQKAATLVDMLLKHAETDEGLQRQLLMLAAKKTDRGPDLATFKQAIDDAVIPDEFVRYDAMYEYSCRVDQVIDAVEDLLKDGHAVEVIELTEYACRALEQALQSVDDSGGETGEMFERLQDLHYAACRKGKPDPKELARRLFEWELHSQWDTFSGAAERYADVFGSQGLAVYRQLAEQHWARVPSSGPGERKADHGKHYRITHIMEGLARQSGNVDAIVAIQQRDLSSSWAYLQIAESYRQAKNHDLALEWAERGMKAFAKDLDHRLREFVAVEYHRRKRHDEAMAIVWGDFTSASGLSSYLNLKSHANRIKQWPHWREQALSVIRERIVRARSTSSARVWEHADHSALVEIFLWEQEFESAWREAKAGGCHDGLWRTLAAWREKDHPQDVVPIYWKEVENALARTENNAYREAIRLLRKIRTLMQRTEEEAKFTRELAALRTAHKAKRNFLKLLDHARW